jgi:hypothetical protein
MLSHPWTAEFLAVTDCVLMLRLIAQAVAADKSKSRRKIPQLIGRLRPSRKL